MENGLPFSMFYSRPDAFAFLRGLNPLTAELALRALIDFTLSSARRFYSSMGNPLDGKGLNSAEKS